jgi:ligand-binding SRPBCC domain-containing protein
MKISKTAEGHFPEAELWVPAKIEDVFAFFSRAENLETITPPFLGFQILGERSPEMKEGTLIDYRIKVHGVPMKWRTRIARWNPPHEFVDTQLKGPYSVWHHTHSFESKDGGTLMKDRVRFRLPLGFLGDLVAGWMVKRDVKQIFEYRQSTIQSLFPG